MTGRLKQIFCWNGKPLDSARSLLVEKRVGGENDCLLNNPIAGTMNKTYERPRWCHCRLQLEIGIVGNWCVRHFGREWAVINIGQRAAVRTAGETRAVFCFFFNPDVRFRGGGAEKDVLASYIFLQKAE